MYVCNNIQEKEATQVYHNHIAVSSWVRLVSCILSAPTPAKVTLAIDGKCLAEVTIPQRQLWQRRTGKKNKRSSCNCGFQVCFCQSSIKKCLEKQNTVLRPWMLAEGFYYKECTTSLNKTNQPTTRSSPSLSQRLSLGNVTFSQEKSFSLIFSIPLHILYTTEDWWCFIYHHLKTTTKYHSHSWTIWFHVQHRREGGTAGYWFYKLWQVNQQGWPDQTNQLGIKFCCCAHSAPGYIEKQPGWRRQFASLVSHKEASSKSWNCPRWWQRGSWGQVQNTCNTASGPNRQESISVFWTGFYFPFIFSRLMTLKGTRALGPTVDMSHCDLCFTLL